MSDNREIYTVHVCYRTKLALKEHRLLLYFLWIHDFIFYIHPRSRILLFFQPHHYHHHRVHLWWVQRPDLELEFQQEEDQLLVYGSQLHLKEQQQLQQQLLLLQLLQLSLLLITRAHTRVRTNDRMKDTARRWLETC